jgi:hypothetical protein
MNVNVTNIGESAYQTQLFVNLADSTSYSKSTDLISMVSRAIRKMISGNCVGNIFNALSFPSQKQDVCSTFENGTIVVCRLGNPMKQNEQMALQLEIDLQAVNEKTPPLSFAVKANTTSEDRRKNDIQFLEVKVVDRVMMLISG